MDEGISGEQRRKVSCGEIRKWRRKASCGDTRNQSIRQFDAGCWIVDT